MPADHALGFPGGSVGDLLFHRHGSIVVLTLFLNGEARQPMSIPSRRWIILTIGSVALFLALIAHAQTLLASEPQHALAEHHEGDTSTAETPPFEHTAQAGHAATNQGDGGHHGHENLGPLLPLWSCAPFACMLLSIALFPASGTGILAPPLRQGVRLLGGGHGRPVSFRLPRHRLYEIIHIILADYVPSLFCCGPCIPFPAVSF
jgi:hypothetical protein